MSNPPERPWTEEEKYALLTEILKKAGVPSTYLFKIINDFHISPSWAEIPLPPGRSLNSCQLAFHNMYQQSVGPMQAPLGPSRSETSALPGPPLGGGISRKRPLQPLERTALTTPRAIQPRPPLSSGPYSSEGGTPIQMSPGLETMSARGEPPRKRGRPSKAETERRKAAAQARGESYPPPRKSGTARSRNPPTPSGAASVGSEGAILSPQPAIHTPEVQKAEIPSGDTTGRAETQIEGGAERPREGLSQEQTEPASGDMRPQAALGRTLPSLQSMQLGLGEETPRTIPGGPAVPPVPPLGVPFSEAGRAVPRGGEPSNPDPQPGLTPEIRPGTSASPGTIRQEAGPGEGKT